MAATLLDGKQLAKTMQAEIAEEAKKLWEKHQVRPGLAAVLVGEDPASQVYVRNKRRACEKAGLNSWLHHLRASTSQEELLTLVNELNGNPEVHGILVQLPLPSGIDEDCILQAVDPAKDVDGFSPVNLGLLTSGSPRYIPCTPHGAQQILLRNGIEIEGKHVVIVGRSTIVGTPLALLLSRKGEGGNATVTICHSRTADIGSMTRQADIVVMAIGRAGFLTADMVRPGAVVVDVGINRLEDGSLAGDVAFEEVSEVASAITPVPGGIGPMTITMLLANTLRSAQLSVEGS